MRRQFLRSSRGVKARGQAKNRHSTHPSTEERIARLRSMQ